MSIRISASVHLTPSKEMEVHRMDEDNYTVLWIDRLTIYFDGPHHREYAASVEEALNRRYDE